MILHADEIPSRQTRPGVIGKEPKLGSKVIFSEWSFPKGTSFPTHTHNHESYGYIVSGKVLVRIHDQEKTLTKGGLFFLEPNTEHYLEILEDCVIVYASSPDETH